MDTRTSPIRLRITQLREILARESVHALLVPSADPHLSEYLPGRWQARQWLSGFTGSSGMLIVTRNDAHFISDFRYRSQAAQQVPREYSIVNRTKFWCARRELSATNCRCPTSKRRLQPSIWALRVLDVRRNKWRAP